MNWYSYCGNNPVSYVDPTGLTYILLRDFVDMCNGELYWDYDRNSAVVYLNGRCVEYFHGDGSSSYIDSNNGRMYVWDEYVYEDTGYYVWGRMKAVNYGLVYGESRNSAYEYYSNNCANFVSQCLLNGGMIIIAHIVEIARHGE